jgi:hypothetical protein
MSAAAEVKDANNLLKRVNDRSMYFGIRVDYQVDIEINQKSAPFLKNNREQIAKGARTLEIGYPIPDSVAVPFRLTHRIKNPGEPYLDDDSIVTYWEAFDGRSSRFFSRSLFYKDTVGRLEHTGMILARGYSQLRGYDPFITALFAGSSTTRRLSGQPEIEIVEVPELRLETIPHSTFGEVYKTTLPGVEGYGLFTMGPEYFEVFHEGGDSLSVQSIASFGDIKLPGRGAFSSEHWGGTFEVLNAERLEPDFDTWFTDWPEGTVVSNRIDNTFDRIPFSAETSQKIHARLHGNYRDATKPIGPQRRYLLYVNIAGLVLLLGVYLWRRFFRLNPR